MLNIGHEIVDIFDLRWAENCGISLSMFANCNDTTRWTLVALTAIVAAAVALSAPCSIMRTRLMRN